MLAVPVLVCHLRTDGRRDNVNGTMAHEKQLILWLNQDNEPATFRPRTNAGFTAGTYSGGTPKVGHGMSTWLKEATGGEMLG